MIVTCYGIILFYIWEWVKFIKSSPPAVSDGFGMSYESDRSRHPV